MLLPLTSNNGNTHTHNQSIELFLCLYIFLHTTKILIQSYPVYIHYSHIALHCIELRPSRQQVLLVLTLRGLLQFLLGIARRLVHNSRSLPVGEEWVHREPKQIISDQKAAANIDLTELKGTRRVEGSRAVAGRDVQMKASDSRGIDGDNARQHITAQTGNRSLNKLLDALDMSCGSMRQIVHGAVIISLIEMHHLVMGRSSRTAFSNWA
jgi:hypothetical protein